jgi:DNA-binding PadR family transcriptional regulator
MYEITPQGIEYLQEWMQDLERTQADIQKLLTTYQDWVTSASDKFVGENQ